MVLDGVDTVISVLGMSDADLAKFSKCEVALVHAAQQSGVRRFIPSGWAVTNGGENDFIEFYRCKQPTLQALQASTMEWCFPQTGFFMNYFATPKPGIGYLQPRKFWIDVENCVATIPGDGNEKLIVTAVEDVGEFVASAIDVKSWPQEIGIGGSLVSLNEVLQIAERARGKPFSVTYQSEEELESQLDPHPASVFANTGIELSLGVIRGRFLFEPNSDALVPMNFTTIEAFINQWWGSGHSENREDETK